MDILTKITLNIFRWTSWQTIFRWTSWQTRRAAWCQVWQQMWPLCHPLSNIFELVSWRSDNEDGYNIFNRWWLWLMMIYIGGHWPKQWAGLAWPNSYWWEFCHFVCLCLCLSMPLYFFLFLRVIKWFHLAMMMAKQSDTQVPIRPVNLIVPIKITPPRLHLLLPFQYEKFPK